jgi:DNA-binding NtrC family response regulator
MAGESSQLRVLIVDDEPLICWSVAETLAECGDVVTNAGSSESAIRALATAPQPIDVVLLDYQLPDSGDLSLLSTVLRMSPDSQVILMSAHCTPEVAKNALALGAYDVVSKPFDMHEVPPLVHAAAHARHR